MKSKECKETPNLAPCKNPEIKIKERRKLIKQYMKAFNKEIKKAIADDNLLLKIKFNEEGGHGMFSLEQFQVTHRIEFTDKKYFYIN